MHIVVPRGQWHRGSAGSAVFDTVVGLQRLTAAAAAGGMDVDVPLDSWAYDDATFTTLIDPEVGERLAAAARAQREARAVLAKAISSTDAITRAMIGDGTSLITRGPDPMTLAVLTRSTRKHLDKQAIIDDTGIDLNRYMVSNLVTELRYLPRPQEAA
jgi:hypothetical protein